MSRKVKHRFIVDANKICYRHESVTELFKQLSGYAKGQKVEINRNAFMEITDDGRGADPRCTFHVTHINARLYARSGVEAIKDTPIGDFVFHFANDNSYTFFTFLNEVLYRNFVYVPHDVFSPLELVAQVAEKLGLIYNDTTEIEIAIDVQNTSPITKIRKFIKNPEYFTILNNKQVKEGEKLACYREIFGRTEERIDRIPTISLNNAEKTIKLKVYNKTREVEEESPEKHYTLSKFNKNQPVWRCELTIKNRALKELSRSIRDKEFEEEGFDTPEQLFCGGNLEKLFEIMVNKVLRFRSKKNRGELVTLLQIMKGGV